MKELELAVATAFSNIVASGAIEKAIEKELGDTVTTLVRDQLRSHGEFGKKLKEHVQAAMQVDFAKLDLPAYNDFILKVIRAQVESLSNNAIAAQLEEQMKSLLAPAPAEIKLSELIENFINDNAEDCTCDGPDRISLYVEESTGSVTGYHHIYFDKKEGKSKYSCAYALHVTDEGEIYSMKIDGEEIKKTLFVGPFYKTDRALYQMYAAGTKLIVDGDEDSISTYYPGRDY